MPEPAAGAIRMSADDDDNQADQQHELADPGMAITKRNANNCCM